MQKTLDHLENLRPAFYSVVYCAAAFLLGLWLGSSVIGVYPMQFASLAVGVMAAILFTQL